MSDVPAMVYVIVGMYLLLAALAGFLLRTNPFKLAFVLVVLLATANGLALIAGCADDCSSAAGAGGVIIVTFGYVPTLVCCHLGRLVRKRVLSTRSAHSNAFDVGGSGTGGA